MSIRIALGDWATQQPIAQAIRYEVFVIEQNIPAALEWDDVDAHCLHAVAYDAQGDAIGTGRLLPDGHIGRMAVKKTARGGGTGGAILQALIDAAQERGDAVVMLNAQSQAEAFYARHGFTRDGAEFLEAGIPHIHMRRRL
jgi:predicted GNAT family N-acyltransferase